MTTPKPKYLVIRDTREKHEKGWLFFETDLCSGTKTQKLNVGDYSLEGYEDIFCIERKGCVTEFANNLTDPRFYRELERASYLKHLWLLLEFNTESLIKYPKIPEIPKHVVKQIKFKGFAALSKTIEIQIKYPNVSVWFVGDNDGMNVAGSIFKRMIEKYGK